MRNLAEQSAEAAKSTSVFIGDTIKAVKNGMQMAEQTAETLKGVVSGAEYITTMVSKLKDSSTEQAKELSEIKKRLEQITQVIQMNSATSEENAAASEELSSQAQKMQNILSAFQLK